MSGGVGAGVANGAPVLEIGPEYDALHGAVEAFATRGEQLFTAAQIGE
ncbi:MAG: hypothetical protein QOK05_474, partial [Chloroflexota bacterium]|nr:hypothetical protein [Chloroflexota bacterium]